MAISSVLSNSCNAARAYAGSLTWGPLVQLSRKAVLTLFKRIENGQLIIKDADGTFTYCGAAKMKEGRIRTQLNVLKETFWVRMFLFADMGFAESYMLGEVSSPDHDLANFFKLFILNRAQLSNATTLTSSLMSTITGLARSTNTLSNSLLNVSAHYDISNEMFAAFLSDDMTYSCPIWLPKSDPKHTEETLETAQDTKLARFITNARIKRDDHVLEIGTGWGSFAIAAVRATGCRITSLTLSVEQKELAEKRIAAAGYTDNIEVILCDYRALPTPREGLYDKVVSIEMLEAVGREFLATYFQCVDRLLKPEGGIAVFQCITMPETRYEGYAKGEDFIRKYIFPGGHLPTVSQLVENINKGSNGTLVVDSVENIGGHYAKTLRLWNQKFMENFDERVEPALMDEHMGMTINDVELFKRKWEYYFTYCEAGFNTKTLGDVIITVGREGAMEMLEDIPL
ncbi:MAG: hypothetical protein M1827_002272 [Pycnora praestabilis]|nr:MAG: hypothetical protein M1827_002272 [Pycnora praestabilis]